jgi:hypothetical protein
LRGDLIGEPSLADAGLTDDQVQATAARNRPLEALRELP